MSDTPNPSNPNGTTNPNPQGGADNPNPQLGINQALTNLLARNNNDSSAVSVLLFDENKKYRDEIRDLKAKLPSGDSRVLTKEQAEMYDKYIALGGLDELSKRLKQGDEAVTENTGFKRRAGVSALAKAESLHDNALLENLAGQTQFVVKPVEETGADGKKVTRERAFAVTAGADGKPSEERFDEWVKTQKAWQDALPALKAGGQTTTPAGVTLPAMPAGGNDAASSAERGKAAQNAQAGMVKSQF